MVPPLRRVTFGKSAPKVTKNALLPVGFLLRRNTFTPVSLRGPAPNGHPCPDGALAASMRLGPLRETCVQPAPKSRSAVFEPFAHEDQKQRQRQRQRQRLKPVLQMHALLTGCMHCRTGFSREGASVGTDFSGRAKIKNPGFQAGASFMASTLSQRLILISTRRFSARPSAVLLSATGRASPSPSTDANEARGMPALTR